MLHNRFHIIYGLLRHYKHEVLAIAGNGLLRLTHKTNPLSLSHTHAQGGVEKYKILFGNLKDKSLVRMRTDDKAMLKWFT